MRYLLILFVALALNAHSALSTIISESVEVENARLQYYFDSDMSSYVCETLVIIAVGTAMSEKDYSTLSRNISTKQPIITVIVDHFPGFIFKSNTKKFVSVYEQFMEALQAGDIAPICNGRTPKKVLIGGHSSGAVAALGAFSQLQPKPDGFIGLDPFSIDEKKVKVEQSVPVLIWGFKETTCQVKINQAANATYALSNSKHRIFYRADNTDGSIKHCDYTDNGCGSACPLEGDGSLVRHVAKSVQNFARAVRKGSFPRDRFILETANNIDLFMNDES